MVGLFALMCLIWGATWLAMTFGVASVPPVFFAGTRFVVAVAGDAAASRAARSSVLKVLQNR